MCLYIFRSLKEDEKWLVETWTKPLANNRRNLFRDKSLPAPPYRLTCQQEFDDSYAKLEAFFVSLKLWLLIKNLGSGQAKKFV